MKEVYKILQLVVHIFAVQSQPQNVTQLCEVSYGRHGPDRSLPSFDFYEVISDPLGITFNECRSRCGNDPQCKSFVFDNNASGIHCGLSESNNIYLAENCSTCFVYTKNCSSDCITYTIFSGGYIGKNQYANYDPSTYNVCKDRCSNDQTCNGFIHNAVTLACRLVDSSYPTGYNENRNYSFSRKECEFGCTTYLAFGKEYLFQDYSHYLMETTTMKECEIKCNRDSNCRGYDFKGDQMSCGLSYSARKSEWNGCQSCTAFSKQCPLGNYSIPKKTCTDSSYDIYHRHVLPSSIYWTIAFSSYNVCQLHCNSDQICHGFAFDEYTKTCTLSESMLPRLTNCPYCTFSAKKCSDSSDDHEYLMQCSPSFTFLGRGMKVSFAKAYAIFSTTDLTACQQHCANDSECLSFHYQSDNFKCQVSKSSVSQSSQCQTCAFYIKHCLPGCGSVSFILYDLGYTVSSIKHKVIQRIPLEECKLLCDEDTYCFGFSFNSNTSRCTLSDSGDPMWYPSDESVSFFKKICLAGSTRNFTTAGQSLTTKEDITQPQTIQTTEKQTVIATDFHEITTVIQSTKEATTDLIRQQQTTEMILYQQSTGLLEEQTGTLQGQQTPRTDINQTINGQIFITNGSVACSCVCKEINQSLEESLKQRKDKLSLNSKTLSSRVRKLTSASDFRSSSSSIAGVVVGVMGCFIALIIAPDLCSVASYIFKKIHAKRDNNIKHT